MDKFETLDKYQINIDEMSKLCGGGLWSKWKRRDVIDSEGNVIGCYEQRYNWFGLNGQEEIRNDQ